MMSVILLNIKCYRTQYLKWFENLFAHSHNSICIISKVQNNWISAYRPKIILMQWYYWAHHHVIWILFTVAEILLLFIGLRLTMCARVCILYNRLFICLFICCCRLFWKVVCIHERYTYIFCTLSIPRTE